GAVGGETGARAPRRPPPAPPRRDDPSRAVPPLVPPVQDSLGPIPADAEPRYCLRCGRRLKPLRQFEFPRCPECRLPYDPDNPDSYRSEPRKRWVFWVPALILVVINAVLVYATIFWMSQSGSVPQLGAALFLAVPFS